MITFTKNKLLLLHRMSLQTPGGDFSFSDNGAIDRIIEEAYESEKYVTREEVAAFLCCSVITKQPFKTENTGAGIYIMLAFLEVNGVRMNPEPGEVVEIARSVEDGSFGYDSLLNWILEKEYR